MKVYIIAAATVCGKIGPDLISTPSDRRHLETWRERTDASLMGAETLRNGEPEMRGLQGRLSPTRMRCIITQRGEIPVQRRLFNSAPAPLVFTSKAHAPLLANRLKSRAKVLPLPPYDHGPSLSLAEALQILKTRGASSLLIEGGGRLNYEALRQKIVDELILTMLPQIDGSNTSTKLFAGPAPLNIQLKLIEMQPGEDQEFFVRYEIKYGK
ncbi:MAG: RibD family protein [Dissulfuribacterales bacterium]